jgi:hypothetical protein
MTFSPGFTPSDDYYKPDQLRNDYERKNPGKSFENFLNQAESEYGKGSMDVIKKGLTSKAPAKPAPKAPAKSAPKVLGKPTPKKK